VRAYNDFLNILCETVTKTCPGMKFRKRDNGRLYFQGSVSLG